MKVSMCRASFAGMYSSMLKPFTSPANLTDSAAGSKRVTVAMPDWPATRLVQDRSTVLPTGVTSPSPVTTMRRRVMRKWGFGSGHAGRDAAACRPSGLDVVLRVIDRELHGGDLLGLFVRDLHAELVFERHHQLDGVQGIRAQIGDESLLVGDFGFGHAELLGNDLLDACCDVAHDSSGSVGCKNS